MVSDAKSVASDVGETVAAIEGLRAIILGDDGEVKDRRALAFPCDAPVHQCGGDSLSLEGFGDLELVELDLARGLLAGGKLEHRQADLYSAMQRTHRKRTAYVKGKEGVDNLK